MIPRRRCFVIEVKQPDAAPQLEGRILVDGATASQVLGTVETIELRTPQGDA